MEHNDPLKDDRGVMIANKSRCKTCIFHDGQTVVRPQRLEEIKAYLTAGTNHVCHNTPYLCRGGREWQALMYFRMGLIEQPIVEALEAKIIEMTNPQV